MKLRLEVHTTDDGRIACFDDVPVIPRVGEYIVFTDAQLNRIYKKHPKMALATNEDLRIKSINWSITSTLMTASIWIAMDYPDLGDST